MYFVSLVFMLVVYVLFIDLMISNLFNCFFLYSFCFLGCDITPLSIVRGNVIRPARLSMLYPAILFIWLFHVRILDIRSFCLLVLFYIIIGFIDLYIHQAEGFIIFSFYIFFILKPFIAFYTVYVLLTSLLMVVRWHIVANLLSHLVYCW